MPELLLVAATERELFATEREPAVADGAERLCCGIGPVEAALATVRKLAERDYRAVLHVGIAGATSLAPGTVVIASEAIYCDIVDPNATCPRVHRVAASPPLLEAARRVIPEAAVLPIGTCGRVGGGGSCGVEAMEGFGVLRAAQLAAIPALEVRVVSNAVADADRARWKIADALDVLREVVQRVVPALIAAEASPDR